MGLRQQILEGREVRVALDEGRNRPPAADHLPIERTYLFDDPGAVVVHPDRMAIRVVDRVPREVDLLDRVERERIEPGTGIECVVARAHEQVVHVEQQPATGAPSEIGEEFRLRDLLAVEPEVGRRVLDEHAPPEMLLGPSDVVGHHVERFPGHRHRQQVGEEAVAYPAPRQVLRDHEGLEAVDEPLQTVQVVPGRRLAGAQRHADPVQREGIVGANPPPGSEAAALPRACSSRGGPRTSRRPAGSRVSCGSAPT